MTYLLFPGRHLLTTSFQQEYLWSVLRLPINKLDLVGKYSGNLEDKIDSIVFAVTSANQENSRYNPVSFYMRALGLDRFSKEYRDSLHIACNIVPIPHFNPNDNFTNFVIKEISEQTENKIVLNPQNTIVLCSTPHLIEKYVKDGFAVLPAEYNYNEKKFEKLTPIDVVKSLVELGDDWSKNDDFIKNISESTHKLWVDYPQVIEKILRIWKDPLLNDSGSLTDTRNYSTYAFGMDLPALLQSKYDDIKHALVSGKIVDEGCADGALMTLLAKDFPDSDLIGIELTSEFTARFLERQRAGEFGGTFVHIHQRNLMDKIFEDNSIDTTICNSTTHEIWSYGDGEGSLRSYLKLKFNQLRRGGHLVIRDVVGPDDKEKIVYLYLKNDDGSDEDIFKKCDSREELQNHLQSLSTYARFKRFAEDYLFDMRKSGRRGDGTKISYNEEVVDDKKYVVLRLKDAMEFITKKDYIDNWQSELNEEFSFWSFTDWKKALVETGFTIIENPNNLHNSSHKFSISWVVENRFIGKVALYEMKDGSLVNIDYPATNMVIVAEKNY